MKPIGFTPFIDVSSVEPSRKAGKQVWFGPGRVLESVLSLRSSVRIHTNASLEEQRTLGGPAL